MVLDKSVDPLQDPAELVGIIQWIVAAQPVGCYTEMACSYSGHRLAAMQKWPASTVEPLATPQDPVQSIQLEKSLTVFTTTTLPRTLARSINSPICYPPNHPVLHYRLMRANLTLQYSLVDLESFQNYFARVLDGQLEGLRIEKKAGNTKVEKLTVECVVDEVHWNTLPEFNWSLYG